MSFGVAFAFPAYDNPPNVGPFTQSGPTLDLLFTGLPAVDNTFVGQSLALDFLTQQYQLPAQYSVWVAGQGLTAKTFSDLITFTRASTATYTDSAGVLQTAAINAPRFDYNPTTLVPLGFLVEEARTNLLLNSGTLITQTVTVTAVAHTLSFYGTGTVTLTGASTAGPLVGTGAYPNRVTLTFTPTAGALILTVTGSVQFANLEAGGFATSYIPTTAAPVPRAADLAAINTLSPWFNSAQGTLFAQFEASPNTYTAYVDISNGVTAQNSIHIDNDTGLMRAVYYSGSAPVAILSLGAIGTVGTVNKVATSYAANDFKANRNGGSVVSDPAGALPVGLTQMNIGADPSGTAVNVINGHIQRITYYPRSMVNYELQALTV
jgi:hypothetical protein